LFQNTAHHYQSALDWTSNIIRGFFWNRSSLPLVPFVRNYQKSVLWHGYTHLWCGFCKLP